MKAYATLVLLAVLAALGWCVHWSWAQHGPIHHCLLWDSGTVTFGSLLASLGVWACVLVIVLSVGILLLHAGEAVARGARKGSDR